MRSLGLAKQLQRKLFDRKTSSTTTPVPTSKASAWKRQSCEFVKGSYLLHLFSTHIHICSHQKSEKKKCEANLTSIREINAGLELKMNIN